MGTMNFRDAHKFDPEESGDQNAGGLLSLLQAVMQQGRMQSAAGYGEASNGYGSPQGGLFGRLLALQSEQSKYQQSPDSGGENASATQSPNVAQGPTSSDNPALGQQTPLRRVHIYAPMQHDAPTTLAPGESGEPVDLSDNYPPDDSETYSGQGGLLGRLRALQTQQGQYQPTPGNEVQAQNADSKEVSPRSLVPGAGSSVSPEAPTFDPIDIAKSLGIGIANGAVNTAGLPADALAVFGYGPSWVKSLSSDALRHFIEKRIGTFYQPKSRAARYAETIGEMAPMVLGGEGAGVIMAALRGGKMVARAAAGSALRELPATLAKHAVAPGIAVQALEEALPESKLGQKLQKLYPLARRAIPLVPAATRYLARRIASY